ncbi:PROP protein, partial [Rhinopomastus cyanomelas]|nr:PROP protein [Rhinopomastus cyanomelas]
PPTAAPPLIWCFRRLEEDGGCADPLPEQPLPLGHCCQNPAFAFRRHPRGLCLPCRPGEWGPWVPWSSCSVTCGEGTQRRGRARTHPEDPHDWELRACELPCCPEAGGWSPWSPWSSCSVSCGSGIQRRLRDCSLPPPKCGGGCSPGRAKETQECQGKIPVCPVAGGWGPWGPWGPCGGSCLREGQQLRRSRSRRCDSPKPSRDPPGPPCLGLREELGPCPGLPYCPQDGTWGSWAKVTPCPVTCGLGVVTLRRSCDAPPPLHGGAPCPGNSTRLGVCGPHGPCPALQQWGPWGPWSPCDRPLVALARCQPDVGQQRRTRECVGRKPGGPLCPTTEGVSTIQVRRCYNVDKCLVAGNWSDWSPWGLCSPPCGPSPSRNRSRLCQPQLGHFPSVGSWDRGGGLWVPVVLWGNPYPRCPPLMGQKLRLEETRPCL